MFSFLLALTIALIGFFDPFHRRLILGYNKPQFFRIELDRTGCWTIRMTVVK